MIENNPTSLICSDNYLEIEKSRVNIYYGYIPKAHKLEYSQSLISSLPQKEQERLASIKNECKKVKSAFGRTLLLHGLKNYGITNLDDLKVMFNGKPYLNNSRNLHFNISHSGNLILCAISDNASIGVDVEKIKPKILDHFKSYFTVQEWQNITINDNSIKRFYDLWTRKEALIKADGRGLSIELSSFSCLGNNGQIEGQNWYVKNFVIDEKYACAIAHKNDFPVQLIKFEFAL
ncbi:MAG: 4'-phosphopantetheinyl transferase superfamily protein [Flavobacterium sp.]|jgi:4'-phosphopantetheinyl transferase|nr:4'-phosphopantetheinyl transferase superfamily protein [Flavobacterium sp.]